MKLGRGRYLRNIVRVNFLKPIKRRRVSYVPFGAYNQLTERMFSFEFNNHIKT